MIPILSTRNHCLFESQNNKVQAEITGIRKGHRKGLS